MHRYGGASCYDEHQRARIGVGSSKAAHVGFFESDEEAARAQDAGATWRHWDKARRNFPLAGRRPHVGENLQWAMRKHGKRKKAG